MAGRTENSEQLLEHLQKRLLDLETRVAALEKRGEVTATTPLENLFEAKPIDKVKRAGTTSVVPVVGKAVLAIAGAYLLRATAESGLGPRWLLQLLAIGYAGAWLVWAARTHRKSHFASVIFGMTTAAILAPLLWEGTVRFQELAPGFTSAVLVGYVAISLALAWKEKLEVIPWIAVIVAVTTMLALLVATHEFRTLTVGLLAIALLSEVAAWSGRWLGLRVAAGLGADAAVGVLGIIMTSAEGAPADYRPMSAGEINALCLALPLIYGTSLVLRGFGMGKKWTFAEVVQAPVAFGLGAWVSMRATHGGVATALGMVLLILSFVCYWGALKRFASRDMRRNQQVSANFAVLLVLAGSFLLPGRDLQSVLFSVAAVAAIVVFTRTGSPSLRIHGTLYLLVACMVSGLVGFAGRAFVGTIPAWPEWSFWAAAGAALSSYLVGSRKSGDGRTERMFWMVHAGVVGLAVAALTVVGIAHLGGSELSQARLSMVRTMVTCGMALGFGYAGSRWNRVELGWVAYGTIGLGALKLIVEDLRFGNAGTLMVSLLFYGLILILLPRLTRFGRVEV